MAVIDERGESGCHHDCAVILLALADRVLLQATEIGRSSLGVVATGVCIGDCQAIAGCQRGLRDGLGDSSG